MYKNPQIIIKDLEKRNRRLYNDLHILEKKNEELKSPETLASVLARDIMDEINAEVIKDMWRVYGKSV